MKGLGRKIKAILVEMDEEERSSEGGKEWECFVGIE